ncbi:MAG: hypothetical protein WC789_11730 [Lentisphaeria bacterium]|jgi:hypothetical protein
MNRVSATWANLTAGVLIALLAWLTPVPTPEPMVASPAVEEGSLFAFPSSESPKETSAYGAAPVADWGVPRLPEEGHHRMRHPDPSADGRLTVVALASIRVPAGRRLDAERGAWVRSPVADGASCPRAPPA